MVALIDCDWMDKTETAKALRAFRRELDLTQDEMAGRLKINRSTYASYEGTIQPPDPILARLRKMGFDQTEQSTSPVGLVREKLASYAGQRVSLAGTPLVPVKIVGYASAGSGLSNVDEEAGTVYVPQRLAQLGGLGWIVDGESMMPKLLPGDVALFREWRQPRARLPFLVKTPTGDFRVKRLIWRDSRWHYESINPAFPVEPMGEGDQLQGYLIGWYRAKGSRETLDSDPDGLTLLEDWPPSF